MARIILSVSLFFLIFTRASAEKSPGFLSLLEDKLENKITDYVGSFAKMLEHFNDKYLGQSELGRLLHYDEIKKKIEETGRRRSMKKMGMSMLPLIFHVGATSTWMVLTTILAAKSVAIGLALLVFKIAVSSAKVASFFTSLKSKQEHPSWSWSPPHYEHHGHDRSLTGPEAHIEGPELHPHAAHGQQWEYHTIPHEYHALSYAGESESH